MILKDSKPTDLKAEERKKAFINFTSPYPRIKWEGKTILQSPKHEPNLLNECDNLSVNKSWD